MLLGNLVEPGGEGARLAPGLPRRVRTGPVLFLAPQTPDLRLEVAEEAEEGAVVLPSVFGLMNGVAERLGVTALGAGGVDDHVHLLVTLRPVHLVSDVLRDLKKSSSRWIHETLGNRRFAWQVGYGPFTVGRSSVPEVERYIERQGAHHRKRTFREEYVQLLRHHGVDLDERYLW